MKNYANIKLEDQLLKYSSNILNIILDFLSYFIICKSYKSIIEIVMLVLKNDQRFLRCQPDRMNAHTDEHMKHTSHLER